MRRVGPFLLAFCSCSDPEPTPLSERPGEPRPAFAPTPPAPPTPPSMTPCPAGWREVVDAEEKGVVTCDPWPEAGAETCAAVDQAHFPGEPGCRLVGTPCPAADWADIPAGESVVFVKAGAPDGDGSRASPFGTIREGVLRAQTGDVVAIAKGTYDEEIVVSKNVTLWGACAAETLVTSSSRTSAYGTIELAGAGGGTVRNLRVSGERPGFWVYGNVSPWTIDSVVIDGARGAGVIADMAGLLVAQDLVVRDTFADEYAVGYGIEVKDAGRADLARVVLERNVTDAVHVDGEGATLVASDLSVRDTHPDPTDGSFGMGIDLTRGGTIRLERAVLEGNRTIAVRVMSDAELVATDLVVRDTEPMGDGGLGTGLYVSEGSRAELHRSLFERNRETGIRAFVDATVEATDLVVRDTRPELATSWFGSGLHLYASASATLERAAVLRNTDAGILLHGGAALAGSDVRIDGTMSRPLDGDFGDGLDVFEAATVELARVAMARNRRLGALASGSGTTVSIDDLEIDATASADCTPSCPNGLGTALASALGAWVGATRFRLTNSAFCGLQIYQAEADLCDGEVSGNLIGVNVQTEGFDAARVECDVLYAENARNSDSPLVAPPEPVSGAEREVR